MGREQQSPCGWCFDTGIVNADSREIECDCGAMLLADHYDKLDRCSLLGMARTLAANLAAAGALCEAFFLGQCREDPYPDNDGSWFPGCGESTKRPGCAMGEG